MDVELYHRAVFQSDYGISEAAHKFDKPVDVKGLRVALDLLQTHQHLGAVAEFQHAVLGEEVGVDGLGSLPVEHFRRALYGLARKGAVHPFQDVYEPRTAGIHHAGLFQHVQQFRGVFQGHLRPVDSRFQHFFQRLKIP